jgi:hypothetical protein
MAAPEKDCGSAKEVQMADGFSLKPRGVAYAPKAALSETALGAISVC